MFCISASNYRLVRRHFTQAILLGGVAIFFSGCASPEAGGLDTAAEIPVEFAFWPPFPNEPRIQHLVSYAKSSDIEPPRKQSVFEKLAFGEDSGDVLPINKPYGVDMWNGKIYTCDIRNQSVVVFDLNKRETRVIGVGGASPMKQPTDVAVADDGTAYVSDKGKQVILVYDAKEKLAAQFGWPGFEPVAVAQHGDELYVCDYGSKQVVVLNRFDGSELRRIGEPGSDEEGGLLWPIGIDIDADGSVYVSDVLAARVQRFDPSGELGQIYGYLSDKVGSFTRPKHIAVGTDKILFVIDAAFQNVQLFNSEGQLLVFFGGPGGHPGAMNLPVGICIEQYDAKAASLFGDFVHPAFKPEQLVLITNQFGPQKVAVYAFGSLAEGKTLDDIAPTRLELPAGVTEDEEEAARRRIELDEEEKLEMQENEEQF